MFPRVIWFSKIRRVELRTLEEERRGGDCHDADRRYENEYWWEGFAAKGQETLPIQREALLHLAGRGDGACVIFALKFDQ